MIDTITGIIIGVIGLGLYWAGFATCALMSASKQSDEITCQTCKHSKGGRCDYYNANCYECLTKGEFTGWEK
jgi:hypothetical protein